MPRYLIAAWTTLLLVAASMLLSPTAQADNPAQADAVFKAWNDSFLVKNTNGDVYYSTTLTSKGTERSGSWIAALNIAVAQDVYQRTHRPADRQLVVDMINTFIKYEGKTWTDWNTWNDDIAWMGLATLRGYQASGNMDLVTVAADQWNKAYNRGWSSAGGGGIWEDMNSKYSKCSLSNNPMITYALQLYQITGDSTYLTKSQQIYDWVRSKLFNTSTGRVGSCIAFPNGENGATELQCCANAYDAGSFVEAANYLYKLTGNSMYYNDAVLALSYKMKDEPIIHNNQGRGSSYSYRFFRGMSEFCTDNANCANYTSYMQSNADAAWSMRNNLNLTWNDWTKPTTETNPDAFMMNGMVALWQQLPITSASPFSGNYLIQNVASKLNLGVKDSSTANSAAVVQGADNGDSSSWTLVPRTNGYYEIRNVHSGQALNVSSATEKLGQAVVQWPFSSVRPGNDLWYPVKNADGTYSFYNRNSQLALDNPGSSTVAGTQLAQWAQNDTNGQKFTLTPRSGSGGGGTTGDPTGPVKSGVAGKCLDATGYGTANGTLLVLWDCTGG